SERSESGAQAAFRALQAKYPNQLRGRQATIRRADLGAGGIYYRALVGPFASAEKAAKLCSGLKAAGGDCIILKNWRSWADAPDGCRPERGLPGADLHHQGPPLVQVGGGVEKGPVLHSIRIAVNASRQSRLLTSPLPGETRHRSAINCSMSCWRMS